MISPNAKIEPTNDSLQDPKYLKTAFNQSTLASNLWQNNGGSKGAGVGVAVVDTGIAGDLPAAAPPRTPPRA